MGQGRQAEEGDGGDAVSFIEDGIRFELPHYERACKKLNYLHRHTDELFAEIDAIEDRDERIRTLVRIVRILRLCETALVAIRLRAERNTNKGLRAMRKAVQP